MQYDPLEYHNNGRHGVMLYFDMLYCLIICDVPLFYPFRLYIKVINCMHILLCLSCTVCMFFFLGRSKLRLDNVYIIMVYCLKAGLSNLFGTAGSTRINLGAAGRNSKQRRKFSEHNKN